MEYYQCTYTDSPTPWCATSIDPAGEVVTNRWEDCSLASCPAEEKPACLTVGGPDEGAPCAFPFTIGEETYSECVEGLRETGCITTTYWGFLTIKTCKVTWPGLVWLELRSMLNVSVRGFGLRTLVLHRHHQRWESREGWRPLGGV